MISAQNSGIVDEVYIQEGAAVSPNDHIVKIDMGKSALYDNDSYHKQHVSLEKRINFIENQLKILEEQKNNHLDLLSITIKKNRQKILMLNKNMDSYKKIHEEQNSILEGIKKNKVKNILSRKDIADLEIQVANTNFRILDINNEIATSGSEFNISQKMHDIEIMSINQKIEEEKIKLAEVTQQLIEYQSSHAQISNAIVDGTVSRVYVKKGDFVEKGSVIAAIAPKINSYEIYLRSSSRKIGKVHVGQEAKIWYQAFPRSDFGTYSGIISYVGKEPDYALASTTPYKTDMDTYLIKVRIEDPYVYKNNEKFLLINGSAVEVSIQLGKKKIISWILGSLLDNK
ncbi:MAG TPA: HlyD family efflux transporter periplasmic adaptor subunit [Cellvibrio sp.]|nr:HlyD family efflux transporter periplasmic adaptor subunit [Cellvibrio sp.]